MGKDLLYFFCKKNLRIQLIHLKILFILLKIITTEWRALQELFSNNLNILGRKVDGKMIYLIGFKK